jgi:very-short-patch-repair endonuclease
MSTPRNKLSIEVARAIAEANGGKCLSDLYVNNKEHLIWQCECTYTWRATLGKVKNRGTWCPNCSPTKKLTIEVAQHVAICKGGLCLSTVYINGTLPLMWQCNKGHTWPASLQDVKGGKNRKGTWCAICNNCAKLTIQEAQQIAISRRGRCLSTTYVNGKEHLEWECEFKHTWFATLNKVKNSKNWCPDCSPTKKLTLEDAHEAARENGGLCLSTEYINIDSDLIWQCEFEHTWPATLHNVRHHNSWCPICKESKGEKAIRLWLENNDIDYDSQFQIEGYRHFYDFYIPTVNLIVEYDGIQHFQHVPFFHREYSLEYRQDLDKQKMIRAFQNGYSMLRIHYKDFDKISELLSSLVTTKLPPQVFCSRTEGYDYLGLNFPESTK